MAAASSSVRGRGGEGPAAPLFVVGPYRTPLRAPPLPAAIEHRYGVVPHPPQHPPEARRDGPSHVVVGNDLCPWIDAPRREGPLEIGDGRGADGGPVTCDTTGPERSSSRWAYTEPVMCRSAYSWRPYPVSARENRQLMIAQLGSASRPASSSG